MNIIYQVCDKLLECEDVQAVTIEEVRVSPRLFHEMYHEQNGRIYNHQHDDKRITFNGRVLIINKQLGDNQYMFLDAENNTVHTGEVTK